MNVYLIEDDPLKAERLISYLATEFPDMKINVFGSFQSGLRAIESSTPDLVILDMTIPTFDRGVNRREGRFRPLGGYDLMRKVNLREIPTSIIVVTQLETFGEGSEEVTFSEISERCSNEFPHLFVGSVYFRQKDEAWKSDLTSLIQKSKSNKF